jgi:hypothetical protein
VYIVIAVILSLVLHATIQLVSNRNWKLLYTAFGSENYFKVIGKLKSAGIKHKTKSRVNLGHENNFKDFTQYDIYVKKEDEHKTQTALHKNN